MAFLPFERSMGTWSTISTLVIVFKTLVKGLENKRFYRQRLGRNLRYLNFALPKFVVVWSIKLWRNVPIEFLEYCVSVEIQRDNTAPLFL